MTDCVICGEPVLKGDVISVIHGAIDGRAHVACTADGWRRYHRVNADLNHETPLLWDRAERPTWRVEPVPEDATSGRAFTHTGCTADCAADCERVTAHPSSGNRRQVGDATVAYP